MSANSVSHNTEAMRNWSNNMEENAENYDMLVNRLYSLVNNFIGSKDFNGGVANDLLERILSQKPAFQKYSSTFRECAELINKRSRIIDNNEAELTSGFSALNPLDR